MAAAPRASPSDPAPTTLSATTICCAPSSRAISAPFTSASCSARSPIIWPTSSAPRARRSRCRPPAPRARRAIQLGVEAIRRGETDAALCIGTDGSINPESLIRFSLLSALSTSQRSAARRPPSRSPRTATASSWRKAPARWCWRASKPRRRAAPRSSACIEGCGEMADSFHRTRSSPDGKPIIGCIRNALADAGLTPDDIDYVNPHGTGTPENDKMECLGVMAVFGERAQERADLVEQVDDRPHAVGGRRGRGGVLAADAAAPAHPADHQLRDARPGDPARRGAERGARRQGAPRHSPIPSASAARTSRW